MRQDQALSDLEPIIRNLRKLIGIWQLHKTRGISLQQAKEQFERQKEEAAAAPPAPGAAPAPATNLAPGEVPATGSAVWVWIIAALVIAGVYLYRS